METMPLTEVVFIFRQHKGEKLRMLRFFILKLVSPLMMPTNFGIMTTSVPIPTTVPIQKFQKSRSIGIVKRQMMAKLYGCLYMARPVVQTAPTTITT